LEAEGITLSIVAAGGGSAEYLRQLAEAGGGQYYPAPTMQNVPQIFLKETIRAVGSYIIEEPFYPLPAGTTPVLQGLDPMTLPPLLGHNGTTPKATAQVALVSPKGDPVLAQWQYGLGRAVAWTSDLKGQWATDWVGWERFNTFAAQLVGWTLPELAGEQMQVSAQLDGAEVRLTVDAFDEQGRPRDLLQTQANLIGPDLSSQTVELEQTAAGRYQGGAQVGEPGTYLVQVVQRDQAGEPVAQRTTGLAVPYSPEYKRVGQGGSLLNDLARTTGGSVLESTQAAFAPTQQPASRAYPLWPALLLMAALLFPLDVAARRLRLTSADWRRLLDWVRERLRGHQTEPKTLEPVLLGDLFEARERARRRGARGQARAESVEGSGVSRAAEMPASRPPVVSQPVSQPPPPEKPRPETDEPASQEDALARLRQARDRARQRRR
jgi:hypothetical protein